MNMDMNNNMTMNNNRNTTRNNNNVYNNMNNNLNDNMNINNATVLISSWYCTKHADRLSTVTSQTTCWSSRC